MSTFLTTTIKSADVVQNGSPAAIPCLIVCSDVATTGQTFAFNPGDAVTDVLGQGLSAQSILYALRATQGTVCASVADATWSSAPSITHKDSSGGNSPTGPTVTVALAAGRSGCADDMTIIVTPTTGGANGTATALIVYDGGTTPSETITVPTEGPAVLTGTVDIGAFTYSPYTGLNVKHLDFTAPAAKVITFSASATSPQDIVDQFNAGAVAAPLAVRARLKYGTGSNLGKIYFELYSTGTGAGVTVTIDATASDADTVLGFASGSSNLTTTGTAATYPLPAAGLVLTFPSGTYVKSETYTMTPVGPRPSGLQSTVNAATAAHDAYVTLGGFGFIAVPFPAPDAAYCASLVAELDTLCLTWLADATPRDIYFGVGGTWHTPSATASTNQTNITANDQALLTGFASAAKCFHSVAQDDCYLPAAGGLGIFRRSAALLWAAKRGAPPRLAATVTEGGIQEAVLTAADGLTRARDENTATVKLAGLGGPGFFVLSTLSDGVSVGFDLGATRAGSTSRLRHDGDVAVCFETARLMQNVILDPISGWKGQRPETDTSTGMASDAAKRTRASMLRTALEPTLLPANGDPNCSDFNVTVSDPVTGKFVDNGQMPVKASIEVLGTIQKVDIIVAASGTSQASTTISGA